MGDNGSIGVVPGIDAMRILISICLFSMFVAVGFGQNQYTGTFTGSGAGLTNLQFYILPTNCTSRTDFTFTTTNAGVKTTWLATNNLPLGGGSGGYSPTAGSVLAGSTSFSLDSSSFTYVNSDGVANFILGSVIVTPGASVFVSFGGISYRLDNDTLNLGSVTLWFSGFLRNGDTLIVHQEMGSGCVLTSASKQ